MTMEDDVTQREKVGLETSDKVYVSAACNPLSFSSLTLRASYPPQGQEGTGSRIKHVEQLAMTIYTP